MIRRVSLTAILVSLELIAAGAGAGEGAGADEKDIAEAAIEACKTESHTYCS